MRKNSFFQLIFLSFLTISANALAVENIDNSRFFNRAVIQVLNKTNAKSDLVTINLNEKTKINSLEIIAHKCWQAPLDQRPESKILLEVFDEKSSEATSNKKRIFYGWMFASSPSISTFEHPIYDIVAINCSNITND